MPRQKKQKSSAYSQSSFHSDRPSQTHPKQQDYTPGCFFARGKIQTTEIIKPATYNQRLYTDSMKKNILTLCSGVPGSGKSLLALYTGIQLLNQENSPIEKIFYLRANVSMLDEKDLGYLPGGLNEKVMALAYPILDNLINFMPETQAKYLVESGRIEVLPISMVRGRSFKNCFVICDEQQNSTPHMIKTLITRIAEGSKMVLIGDSNQKDSKNSARDGLSDATNRLEDLEDVGIVFMNQEDIIRSAIIKHFLERYED